MSLEAGGNAVLSTLENATGQLSAMDVARIFGISRSTVYRMVASNRIPSYRMNSCLRFDPMTLRAWLKKQDPNFQRYMGK